MNNQKIHYKMYKKGSKWVFAAIVMITIGIAGWSDSEQSIHADTANSMAKTATSMSSSAKNSSTTSSASSTAADSQASSESTTSDSTVSNALSATTKSDVASSSSSSSANSSIADSSSSSISDSSSASSTSGTYATIQAKDSVISVGTKWNAKDNFTKATDSKGNDIPFSEIRVAGEVDTNKPGKYEITYSYTESGTNTFSTAITVIVTGVVINAHDSTIVAGPTTKWNAENNFDSATDESGDIPFSKFDVTGSVDTTKAGEYEITYSCIDKDGNRVSKTITVTVVKSKAAIDAKDSTIIAGSNTKWTAGDNFTSATDENGNPLQISDLTVSGTVDPTKAGNYEITYSYTDGAGNQISKTITVTVVNSKAAIDAKDSTIIAGPNTKWNKEDNFISATDENGNPLQISDLEVSGSVDPTKAGKYEITYSYTDGAGNKISKTITVTVVASKAAIEAKDSTIIAGPATKWNAENNFTSATDENGNPLQISDLDVSGSVDPTKPGKYEITYSYTDGAGNQISKTITVTVVASKAAIEAKDSTIIAGPNTKWNKEDNFISATDENGNPLKISDLEVTGSVDPTKPGKYEITYSYTDGAGNQISKTITVTVVASKAAIDAKDSTIVAGPTTKWNAGNNFTSATDENGNPLQISNLTVTGSVDPTKPGKYEITYSYTDGAGNQISKTITVTVVASKAAIDAKDSTIVAGPTTKWNAENNFISATDENGNPLKVTDLEVTGSVDPTKPGKYEITYSYTDGAGNQISKTITVTVVASKAAIDAKDSTIVAGPTTKWNAGNNFTSATDENGNPLQISNLTVTGSVDPTKPGKYEITYSYTDGAGNQISKTITVTVVASKAAIDAKDSTIVAGPTTKWNAGNNFTSATDENGNPLKVTDLEVTGSVDPTKSGKYEITYSYTDGAGNQISKTITVTVVASKAAIDAKDSTIVAGPTTKWNAGNNFTSATDENGNPLQISDLTVTGSVDPTKPGKYEITYSYTDGAGNQISKTITVTVVASKAAIDAKDSTIVAGPTTKWNAGNNFTSATDENGNPLQISDLEVTGSVDPTKSGKYEITYSYTDGAGNQISKTITVTVVASKAAIDAKDSTIVAGPTTKWNAGNNFTSATDENGNPLQISDLTVTGSVDPTKPGKYEITYSYTDGAGNQISKTITVTVVASKAAIDAKDSTIIAGPTTKWSAENNFNSATDENGKPLQISDLTVSGTVDPTKPGKYEITYSYTDGAGNQISKTITVTVVASRAAIDAKDSTIIAGPTTKWNAGNNFTSATDENGNPLKVTDLEVTGSVDPTKPGKYKITYSYTDGAGNQISKMITVTVVASKAAIDAKDSTIIAGPNTKWNAKDNFTSATDENGNPLKVADLEVTGSVDPTKPGNYEITYSYTDGAGNKISKTITVTVVASKATIEAKDSTITAGTAWNASNNFIGAKDENGRELRLSDLTISGKVDTQTPGRYTIVYSYTDSAGNTISKTITVTVIASQSPDNKNNDDSNVAPFNNDGSNENLKTNDGDNSNISGSSVKAKSLKNNKDQSSQTLPQTGEEQNTLMSVIGMLILALAGVGTFWGFKRHTKKDKQ
ncbi:bacterial Ig-like domain-containing protein [Liquorilactobacillus ghanensis]|uniref:bacterial Ig-like domain-containing protein n=2 Tax=Liquorilactobacillus ghanensis TaxID=399370 RepID=UPI0039E8444B